LREAGFARIISAVGCFVVSLTPMNIESKKTFLICDNEKLWVLTDASFDSVWTFGKFQFLPPFKNTDLCLMHLKMRGVKIISMTLKATTGNYMNIQIERFSIIRNLLYLVFFEILL